MSTKICRVCKESKSSTVRIFGRDKNQPDGLATLCKVCRRIKTNALRNNGTRESRILQRETSEEVTKMSMSCKKCGNVTRAIYINLKDYDRLKGKFYCAQCLEKASSDEQLFDAVPCTVGGIGEVRPSELPLMSS